MTTEDVLQTGTPPNGAGQGVAGGPVPEDTPPSRKEQLAFLGLTEDGEDTPPPATPPPAAPAAAPTSAPVETPPPLGTFKTPEAVYKSWQEAVKMQGRTANEKHTLAQENERLKAELQARPVPPPAVPPSSTGETDDQLMEQFVANPAKVLREHQARVQEQMAKKYFEPLASALVQLGRLVQDDQFSQQLPTDDQALYRQMAKDGTLEQFRGSLPEADRGMSNVTLFRLAKSDLLQHQTASLSQQAQAEAAQRTTRNARVATERAGSPTAPARSVAELSDEELKTLAYEEYHKGEHML